MLPFPNVYQNLPDLGPYADNKVRSLTPVNVFIRVTLKITGKGHFLYDGNLTTPVVCLLHPKNSPLLIQDHVEVHHDGYEEGNRRGRML